jgi:hypothetical protein
MNLSNECIAVLKNFSTINPSVWVNEGNVLRTISPAKTIMASAVVDDEFPTPFGIYDLNQFLGTIGLFNNPNFEFKDTHVILSKDKSKMRYGYVDKALMTSPPEKNLVLPDVAVEFRLANEDLQKVVQACNVLQLPNICVRSTDNELCLVSCDVKNTDNNEFSIVVGESKTDESFTFRLENLKMMPNDYDVKISSQGISEFTSSTKTISYFIATETD